MPPSPEGFASKVRAEQDLKAIRELRNHPAWKGYFERRLREMLNDKKNEVLEDDISPEERNIRHKVWRACETFVEMIHTDEATAAAVVNQRAE